MKAILALADGGVFEGEALGHQGEINGEIVFNTSMMGYEEILTYPSYKGQIVTMTYPLVGNYGINIDDFESKKPFLEGFIIKENSDIASNWRSKQDLNSFLKEHKIVGIQNIDTRLLTRHIRDKGSQPGIISTLDLNHVSLQEKAKKLPGLIGKDLVKEVTCQKSYDWEQGEWDVSSNNYNQKTDTNYKIIAYDFGIKRNILRQLIHNNCEVKVVPAGTTAEDVLKLNPDGVFLSNGPGDPEGVPYAIDNIKKLIGKIPLFGICLGHQLLGLALGAKIYKLKFGHHGANHPVKDLSNGKIEITAQNHNFNLSTDNLPADLEITHVNLYDQTMEGLRHKNLPVFSVQYHPEASPGPHDSHYLFARFNEVIKHWKANELYKL